MTDREIIEGLIARDERVTGEFFFGQCRPLLCSIIALVFNGRVDYDELVNELYLYLMENDAARLRGFEFRSSVYQWLKVLAILLSCRGECRGQPRQRGLGTPVRADAQQALCDGHQATRAGGRGPRTVGPRDEHYCCKPV